MMTLPTRPGPIPRSVWAHMPGPGQTMTASTPNSWPPAIDATSSTATATGDARRSSRISTPIGTTSTWRSRTGSTIATSEPSCATRTRSSPPRCTSSDAVGGTDEVPWSPTATSTSDTTGPSPTSSLGRRRSGSRSSGSTTSQGRHRSSRPGYRPSACCSSGRRGPGSRRLLDGPFPKLCRSPSSARRDRSTPASRRASRCMPGYASMRSVTRPTAAPATRGYAPNHERRNATHPAGPTTRGI